MKISTFATFAFFALTHSVFAIDEAQWMPIAYSMMEFPEHPTESAFRSIESKMEKLSLPGNSENDRHITLICASFLAAAHERYKWPITGNDWFCKRAREIISGESSFAKYVKDDTDIDTSKFDVWWMSYLGSQDEKYLFKLLKYAGSRKPKNDPAKAAFIEVATWSFKSNCQQISGVKEFAKRCLNDPVYKDKRHFLLSCVNQK